MRSADFLLQLLIDFFDLPPEMTGEHITQSSIAAWDSLAMVQLITELQQAFSVEFDLEEIEALRSYDEIRASLARKGITFEQTASPR